MGVLLILIAGLTAISCLNGTDVLTSRYDIARTGANTAEQQLRVDNISGASFGKLFERTVDGDIYAQPLVKTSVKLPGNLVRDLVLVATTNNSLYAFDANSPTVAQPYWHVTKQTLGEPVHKTKVTDLPESEEYRNFESRIGIVATPVIDEQTQTIYVVAHSSTAGAYRFRLHAFDLASGREKTEMHSPVEIEASYQGNGIGSEDGRLRFHPRKMLNRPGLLLIGGAIYIAFSAHLDGEPSRESHGWIMAYDSKSLKQLSAVCTTPDGIQGGIWQSGTGLSADKGEGPFPLIYGVAGNGSVGGRNFSQSILQLFPGRMLSVKQAFTPNEHEYQNDRDLDLSTGPLLVPGLPLVIACSKEGKCYVVNRANMRLVQEFQAGFNSYGGERPSNIHGTPVAWRDAQNQLRLYVWGEEDFLRAYRFDGQRFVGAGKSSMRAPEKSMPGGSLALSANGGEAGSALVWAAIPIDGDANMGTVAGMLRCFDALHLEKELWNSEQNRARDHLGMLAKFCPPVVANGKVYMATFAGPVKKGETAPPNRLVVYGALTK